MKALIGNAFLLGLALATASVVACSSGSSTNGHTIPASNTENGTGTIGMKLTLPGGAQINSINYTINGPNGASTLVTSGTINVQNSAAIFFDAPGIPAGAGYTVTLTGADDAGDTCIGTSAQFAVTARVETNVLVQLQCHGTTNPLGSATISGLISDCATWQSVATNPGETTIGSPALITFSATGPNKSGLTYSTTVSGPGAGNVSPATGTVSSNVGATAAFNCTAPGLETVTFVFGDGPLPAGGSCDPLLNTVTVQIQCDGTAVDSGTPVVDSGTPVVDSGTPVVDSGTPVVDSGTTVVDSGTTVVDSGTTVVDSGPNLPALFLAVVKQYNANATAPTPTELQFLKKDVANVTAKVNSDSLDPVLGFTCANCLETNDCLNTAVDNVSGKECEDVLGNAAGTGAKTGTARSALCETLLTCMFSTAPTCVVNGISQACYCGATPLGSCGGVPQGTGSCAQQEADGLELAITDAANIVKGFGNGATGGGQANNIFGCAKTNGCSSCWQ